MTKKRKTAYVDQLKERAKSRFSEWARLWGPDFKSKQAEKERKEIVQELEQWAITKQKQKKTLNPSNQLLIRRAERTARLGLEDDLQEPPSKKQKVEEEKEEEEPPPQVEELPPPPEQPPPPSQKRGREEEVDSNKKQRTRLEQEPFSSSDQPFQPGVDEAKQKEQQDTLELEQARLQQQQDLLHIVGQALVEQKTQVTHQNVQDIVESVIGDLLEQHEEKKKIQDLLDQAKFDAYLKERDRPGQEIIETKEKEKLDQELQEYQDQPVPDTQIEEEATEAIPTGQVSVNSEPFNTVNTSGVLETIQEDVPIVQEDVEQVDAAQQDGAAPEESDPIEVGATETNNQENPPTDELEHAPSQTTNDIQIVSENAPDYQPTDPTEPIANADETNQVLQMPGQPVGQPDGGLPPSEEELALQNQNQLQISAELQEVFRTCPDLESLYYQMDRAIEANEEIESFFMDDRLSPTLDTIKQEIPKDMAEQEQEEAKEEQEEPEPMEEIDEKDPDLPKGLKESEKAKASNLPPTTVPDVTMKEAKNIRPVKLPKAEGKMQVDMDQEKISAQEEKESSKPIAMEAELTHTQQARDKRAQEEAQEREGTLEELEIQQHEQETLPRKEKFLEEAHQKGQDVFLYYDPTNSSTFAVLHGWNKTMAELEFKIKTGAVGEFTSNSLKSLMLQRKFFWKKEQKKLEEVYKQTEEMRIKHILEQKKRVVDQLNQEKAQNHAIRMAKSVAVINEFNQTNIEKATQVFTRENASKRFMYPSMIDRDTRNVIEYAKDAQGNFLQDPETGGPIMLTSWAVQRDDGEKLRQQRAVADGMVYKKPYFPIFGKACKDFFSKGEYCQLARMMDDKGEPYGETVLAGPRRVSSKISKLYTRLKNALRLPPLPLGSSPKKILLELQSLENAYAQYSTTALYPYPNTIEEALENQKDANQFESVVDTLQKMTMGQLLQQLAKRRQEEAQEEEQQKQQATQSGAQIEQEAYQKFPDYGKPDARKTSVFSSEKNRPVNPAQDQNISLFTPAEPHGINRQELIQLESQVLDVAPLVTPGNIPVQQAGETGIPGSRRGSTVAQSWAFGNRPTSYAGRAVSEQVEELGKDKTQSMWV